MVGSINAPATGNTYDAFKAAALAVTNPPANTNTGAVTGGVHGIATAAPVPGTSSGSNSSGSGSSGASKLAVGAGVVMLSAIFAVMMA